MWLLLFASVCLFVLAVIVLRRVPVRLDKTLSQHINQTASTILAGRILLAAAGLALVGWAVWLNGTTVMMYLTVLLGLCLIAIGQLPYGQNRRVNLAHDAVTWGAMLLILALELYGLVVFGGEHMLPVLVLGGAIAVQLLMILMYVFIKPSRKTLMLVGQFVYFTLMMMSLIVMELYGA